MIVVNVTARCHCQLPIARLALLGLFCTSHGSTVTCTLPEPSPVVHDIHSCSFFSSSIFYFPDASAYCTLHPSAQDQRRPTHPWNSMHLCMSWEIPLTGSEISEIATKHPKARRQKPQAGTLPTPCRTHTLRSGAIGGPPFPIPLPTPQPA